jgi:hypothetical protein
MPLSSTQKKSEKKVQGPGIIDVDNSTEPKIDAENERNGDVEDGCKRESSDPVGFVRCGV